MFFQAIGTIIFITGVLGRDGDDGSCDPSGVQYCKIFDPTGAHTCPPGWTCANLTLIFEPPLNAILG